MDIIINGANGRMGKVLAELIKTDSKVNASALVDCTFETNPKSKTFNRIFEYSGKSDVIIDFSVHSSVPILCTYAVKTKTPLVIATTGHTDKEKSMIFSASKHIPVFYSANMSLGVSLTVCIAKMAAKAFPESEIEIIETHHDKKSDSPSGTALMLAEAIRSVRPRLQIKPARSATGPRGKDELYIHSLRLGTSAGSHEIIFALPFQTVTIKHDAHDRRLFAEGALAAAKFIVQKESGLYCAEDILE